MKVAIALLMMLVVVCGAVGVGLGQDRSVKVKADDAARGRVRVVDAQTGKPIKGALLCVAHRRCDPGAWSQAVWDGIAGLPEKPLPEAVENELQAKATFMAGGGRVDTRHMAVTNADGAAVVGFKERVDQYSQVMVIARGYCPVKIAVAWEGLALNGNGERDLGVAKLTPGARVALTLEEGPAIQATQTGVYVTVVEDGYESFKRDAWREAGEVPYLWVHMPVEGGTMIVPRDKPIRLVAPNFSEYLRESPQISLKWIWVTGEPIVCKDWEKPQAVKLVARRCDNYILNVIDAEGKPAVKALVRPFVNGLGWREDTQMTDEKGQAADLLMEGVQTGFWVKHGGRIYTVPTIVPGKRNENGDQPEVEVRLKDAPWKKLDEQDRAK